MCSHENLTSQTIYQVSTLVRTPVVHYLYHSSTTFGFLFLAEAGHFDHFNLCTCIEQLGRILSNEKPQIYKVNSNLFQPFYPLHKAWVFQSNSYGGRSIWTRSYFHKILKGHLCIFLLLEAENL